MGLFDNTDLADKDWKGHKSLRVYSSLCLLYAAQPKGFPSNLCKLLIATLWFPLVTKNNIYSTHKMNYVFV